MSTDPFEPLFNSTEELNEALNNLVDGLPPDALASMFQDALRHRAIFMACHLYIKVCRVELAEVGGDPAMQILDTDVQQVLESAPTHTSDDVIRKLRELVA